MNFRGADGSRSLRVLSLCTINFTVHMDKYTSPHGLLFLCRARVPVDGNAGEKQIAFNVWGACGLSHFSGGWCMEPLFSLSLISCKWQQTNIYSNIHLPIHSCFTLVQVGSLGQQSSKEIPSRWAGRVGLRHTQGHHIPAI